MGNINIETINGKAKGKWITVTEECVNDAFKDITKWVKTFDKNEVFILDINGDIFEKPRNEIVSLIKERQGQGKVKTYNIKIHHFYGSEWKRVTHKVVKEVLTEEISYFGKKVSLNVFESLQPNGDILHLYILGFRSKNNNFYPVMGFNTMERSDNTLQVALRKLKVIEEQSSEASALIGFSPRFVQLLDGELQHEAALLILEFLSLTPKMDNLTKESVREFHKGNTDPMRNLVSVYKAKCQ